MGRKRADDVYVVDKVLRAKVAQIRGKSITWNYFVKWEGYGNKDNTWEPESSFQGTSLLREFWENADSGDRDIGKASLFDVGEEVIADSRQYAISSASRAASTKRSRTASGKREAPIDDEGTGRSPAKRARTSRASASAASTRAARKRKPGAPRKNSVSAAGQRRSKRRHPNDSGISDGSEEEEEMAEVPETEDGGEGSARKHRRRNTTQHASTSNSRRRSGTSRREHVEEEKREEEEEEHNIEHDDLEQELKASSRRKRPSARARSSRKKKEPTSISEDEQFIEDKLEVASPPRRRRAPTTQYKSSRNRNRQRRKSVVQTSDSEDDPDGEFVIDHDTSKLKVEVVITSSARSSAHASDTVPESPGGSLFSEEEVEENVSSPVAARATAESSSTVAGAASGASEAQVLATPEVSSASSQTQTQKNMLKQKSKSPSMPAHRARVANPLVKFIDDPRIMQSVKAKLQKREAHVPSSTSTDAVSPATTTSNVNGTAGTSASTSKAVNRPSLLTAEKGHLTMQKGKYTPTPRNGISAGSGSRNMKSSATPDNSNETNTQGRGDDMQDVLMEIEAMSTQPAIMQPPSGDELLRLAGLDGGLGGDGGSDLPDFDADAEGVDDDELAGHGEVLQRVEDISTTVPVNISASTTGLSLMSFGEPGGAFSVASPSPLTMSGAWRIGTIFEPATPISMKSGSCAFGSKNEGLAPTNPSLSLRLDPSNSVAVVLKDVQPSKDDPAKRLTDLLPLERTGPPGKLYADGVLNSVKSTGSSARLALDESADATQINHYKQLQEQLDTGKLFITTLGGSVLVMLASQSRTAGEKLGIASVLLGLSQTVIVAQVSIEDGSAYAEYAMNAEDLQLT